MGKAAAGLGDQGIITGFHQCLLVAKRRFVEKATVCYLLLTPVGKGTNQKTLDAPLRSQASIQCQN